MRASSRKRQQRELVIKATQILRAADRREWAIVERVSLRLRKPTPSCARSLPSVERLSSYEAGTAAGAARKLCVAYHRRCRFLLVVMSAIGT
jgi:hypothetical protein